VAGEMYAIESKRHGFDIIKICGVLIAQLTYDCVEKIWA
jgi:hypothetical protein